MTITITVTAYDDDDDDKTELCQSRKEDTFTDSVAFSSISVVDHTLDVVLMDFPPMFPPSSLNQLIYQILNSY